MMTLRGYSPLGKLTIIFFLFLLFGLGTAFGSIGGVGVQYQLTKVYGDLEWFKFVPVIFGALLTSVVFIIMLLSAFIKSRRDNTRE